MIVWAGAPVCVPEGSDPPTKRIPVREYSDQEESHVVVSRGRVRGKLRGPKKLMQ